jgi:hypothetical protein
MGVLSALLLLACFLQLQRELGRAEVLPSPAGKVLALTSVGYAAEQAVENQEESYRFLRGNRSRVRPLFSLISQTVEKTVRYRKGLAPPRNFRPESRLFRELKDCRTRIPRCGLS